MRDEAEIAKAKARAIGDIVREEGANVKGELDKSKDAVADAAKEVGGEVKEQAESTKDQIAESSEKIADAAEKAAKKNDKNKKSQA